MIYYIFIIMSLLKSLLMYTLKLCGIKNKSITELLLKNTSILLIIVAQPLNFPIELKGFLG